MVCFICKKHANEVAPPPGGYIYEDACWKICHAPVDKGLLGTLLIESRRHFLDYGDMNPNEAAAFGPLLVKVYAALKLRTGAERIYLITLIEGTSHFHAWLVPRAKGIAERGIALLQKETTCREEEARSLAAALRAELTAA
jgi:diadenosine tetraphosphate (Ap4A) HIT family hydrolase